MNQGFAPVRGVGPPLDIDHSRQVALPIDQEDRPQTVAKPVKPLDRRQASVEGRVLPPGFRTPVRRDRARCQAKSAPVETLRFS